MNLLELYAKIGIDTSQYDKGVQDAAEQSDTLKNKISVLATQYNETNKRVRELTQEFNKSAKENGAASEETRRLANELSKAEKEAGSLESQIRELASGMDKLSEGAGETGDSMDESGESAANFFDVLKANLASQVIIGGFNLIVDGVKKVTGAMAGLVKDSVTAYAEYEQLVGGVETLFGDSADLVQEYAANAYKTAGLSANEYMETATGFAASMIQSLSRSTDALTEEEVKAMSDALDEQYKEQKKALEKQYDAAKDGFDSEYKERKKSLDKQYDAAKETYDAEYDALKKSLDKEYNATKEAYDNAYNALKTSLDKRYDAAKEEFENEYNARKKSLDQAYDAAKEIFDAEYAAFEKTLDDEISALEKAQSQRLSEVQAAQEAEVKAYQEATEEKLKLIDEEYKEALKLIDREEYERLQAIDAQINRLNAQSEAERKAREKAEQEQKKTDLQKAIRAAKTSEQRQEAEKKYNDYIQKLALEQREAERKDQIAALKEQQNAIKEQAKAQKEAAKEEYGARTEAVKEAGKEELDALKTSQKNELSALKEAQKDELSALKDSKKEQLAELKKSQSDQLNALKESNADELTALKKSQSERLTAIKDANAEELTALKKSQSDKLTALKESDDEHLTAVKKGQSDRLSALKEANAEQLDELKKSQANRLTAIKEANSAELDALKERNDTEKQLLKEQAESGGESVAITAEMQEEAARLTDLAIVDMSDNANKMGTDMASLQNAYNGFAKQNYTMLDNLKIGYSGTKEEMQRLLDKAEELSGVHYDISSFSDIVKAIHEVQSSLYISGISADEAAEFVQQGLLTEEEAFKLMGTTAKEAATTIQGSTMAMRASWENLLVGFARDDVDLDALISTFIDSAETALDNTMPRITQVLSGISDAIIAVAPFIEEKLPELIEALKPGIRAALELAFTFIAGILPELLGPLADAALELVDIIGDKLAEKIPFLSGIFENLETVVTTVITAFAAYKTSMMITGIIDGLSKALAGVKTAFTLLHAVMMANPIVLIVTLIAGLIAALVTLWNTNEDFRNAVIKIGSAILDFVSGIIESVVGFFTKTIPEALAKLRDFVSEKTEEIKNFFVNAYEGVKAAWTGAAKWFSDVWNAIVTALEPVIEDLKERFSLAWAAIKLVWDAVTGYFENIWNTIAGIFEAVERVLKGDFEGAWKAIQGVFTGWTKFFSGLWDDVLNIFGKAKEAFLHIGENIVNGLREGISGLWNGFLGFLGVKTDEAKEQFTGPEGFDERSPSHWSEKVFRRVLEGGEIGLERGLPDMLSTARDTVSDIQRSLDADSFGIEGTISSNAARDSGNAFSGAYPGAAPQNQQPIQIVIHVDLAGTELTTLVRTIYPYLQEEANRRGTGW